jgi:inosine/guanosine/xanthosine phosphorylase family protein
MPARDPALENTANVAALRLRSMLGIEPTATIPVAIILGTGWGDALSLEDASREIPIKELPGFENLRALEGHRRGITVGRLGGVRVAALSGRVHLNESHDPDHWKMVRLQTELLIQLGAKAVIVTCAAGSLVPNLRVGDVLLIDSFLTIVAPPMPLLGGEFVSPEDAIDGSLMTTAYSFFIGNDPRSVSKGCYAMLRGPQFEGRKHDKAFLRAAGAKAVGMSVLPEACVAALYPGVRVMPMAFITNSATEEHSHEENIRRAKERAPLLGEFITRIVRALPKA